jgi:hypothetical protein
VNRSLAALILLAAVAASGSAQVGIGMTVGYSPALAAEMDTSSSLENQYPAPLFWGVTLRYKPSLLLIDSGVSFWDFGSLYYGYLDLGLSIDLWVFRVGLSGGVDVVSVNPSRFLDDPSLPSYYAVGFNGKVGLDLKLEDATVGLSVGIPVDALVNVLRNNGSLGGTHDGLRLVTAQASLNFVYWFGGTGSSRRR